MSITNVKWVARFLDLARHISNWSKDPSTKVGAVIVDDKKRIVSVGYNGFPIGVDDDRTRYDNRSLKYKLVCHAERNALDNASVSVEDCTMFVTLPPCNECAKSIIQRGIKHVVSAPLPEKLIEYDWNTDVYGWREAELMLDEANVSFVGRPSFQTKTLKE